MIISMERVKKYYQMGMSMRVTTTWEFDEENSKFEKVTGQHTEEILTMILFMEMAS